MSSNIIDISVPLIVGMVHWPGATPFSHTWTQVISSGDGVNVSMISCDLHTGTHIDAPLHYIADGMSVEKLELDLLCGLTQVVEISGVNVVTAELLASSGILAETERLLLKTDNSSLWNSNNVFHNDYVALTKDAAQFLVNFGVRLFGIDYLSVQRFNDPPDVHKLLLQDGIVLVEGLNLSTVTPGLYELFCLPLRIVGAEGAPVRAILRRLG